MSSIISNITKEIARRFCSTAGPGQRQECALRSRSIVLHPFLKADIRAPRRLSPLVLAGHSGREDGNLSNPIPLVVRSLTAADLCYLASRNRPTVLLFEDARLALNPE
jgi:hypothetical protein